LFAAVVVVSLLVVGGVVGFVVLTLRKDAGAARARDERTEAWLAEMTRQFDLQAAAHERAAEAMLAARHRSDRRPRAKRDPGASE
jgi:hypothetical protein